ncbi:SDR family oxidoreductase [Micromonospora sp. WMMD1120]|uniref:SDR family NAD(P)-dependent oxidoreductase n=1 Tax=Micromonospora sp. WMMD1120 TaxID=3016106 RepID=UPI002417DBEE|nr:SDR family oxidoreductase [Micromonospora sp. WMMD1120]MDG4807065.1 SDR family oxidoreductase [Micromonospora sp. WMMD1120]
MPLDPATAERRALITGATAGIGAAFTRRLAADGWHLVLVARDATRLSDLAAELGSAYGNEVETIPADLSTDDGCALVERRLTAGSPVRLLVNNAGISLNKPFLRSTAEDEARLLRLNVHAVMRLTLAALRPMTERRNGAVINVSSVAGFGTVMPGSTYSASKAWVTNFSESVGQSVRPLGVRVMALCPGYTRTEFHQRAGINMTKTPEWLWLRAEDVVDEALRDLRKGKMVSVPAWKYKVAVAGLRHTPRWLLQAVARDTRGRIGRDEH